MTDFQTQINELRESIYHGSVTDGVTTLGTWLLAELLPEERVEVLLELILLSISCGDLEEAVSRWDEVVVLTNPETHAHAKVYRALFLMLEGKKKRGLAIFEECLLDSPDNFEFYLIRGLGYSVLERFDHAQADLERANSLYPNNVLIMANLADVCVELHDVERAIALHEAVLEACPDFRRSLMSLGILFYDMNRIEDGFRLFQCLIAYDPMNWFAWTCLGDARMMTPCRTFQALPYYAAAIVSGADAGQTYLNLSRGLFMLGKYEQAIRVLKNFESSSDRHWEREELVSSLYLQLIGDVIKNPNFFHSSAFIEQFQKLKPYNDSGNLLLFRILAELNSFTYGSDISTIFYCHMSGFIEMARYMTMCENRVIQPEEAILLGVLARTYIWHGLHFEARALIGLLSKADDPRVVDMTAVLWNDVYASTEASINAGVDVERFHEYLIHDQSSEGCYEQLSAGKKIDLNAHVNWRIVLAQMLELLGHDDFSNVLYKLPYEKIVQALDNFLKSTGSDRSYWLKKFWTYCEMWCVWNDMERTKSSDRGFFDDKNCSHDELLKIIQKFDCLEEKKKQPHISRREAIENRGWCQILSAIAKKTKNLDEKPEICIDNDDNFQVCAADPTEALSGFEPLPFALDGTAFKRFMPLHEETVCTLEESTLDEFWKEYLLRSRFVIERCLSSDIVPYPQNNKKYQKDVSLCMTFWRALHGQLPVNHKLFKLADGSRVPDMVLRSSGNHPVCPLFLSNELVSVLTNVGWKFPESSCLAEPILYKRQKVPGFPRAASILNQPVPFNFLTCRNLYEQFFNRAVLAVENWFKTREYLELSIFFGKCDFRFQKFVCKSQGNSNPHIKIKTAGFSRMQIHIPAANNTDTERRVVKKEQPKKSLRSTIYKTRNEIKNTQELGESLDRFKDWSRRQRVPGVLGEFNRGGVRHPFIEQFKHWADRKVSEIWHWIAEIETAIREKGNSELYLVVWRIHNILNRYPWLSRLYVLLAGVYVRMGEREKAVQTIQAGLEWEDKLYENVGWLPVHPDANLKESALDSVCAPNEFEEQQELLWAERFVFQPHDEAMYHYGQMNSGFGIRTHRPTAPAKVVHRIVWSDKGGCYEFYRLFRKFIMGVPQLMDVWLSAICEPGVYSLRDYLVYVITNMVSPETFPLRRELAEMLFQLYPNENPGALGRFYCDNLQTANALPYAAYAFFANIDNDEYDDVTQSSVTLGCLLYDMGYMEEAVKYLDRAVSVKNPSPMAFLTKGCALIETRDFEKAIHYLKEGQKIDPASDRFFYNLALAYVELGRLDDAEKAIKSGIELSKFPIDLNLQLMRIYVKKEQFVDALPLARYVASEDPEMFLNAIKFGEFEKFVKLKSVQELIDECTFGVPQ